MKAPMRKRMPAMVAFEVVVSGGGEKERRNGNGKAYRLQRE